MNSEVLTVPVELKRVAFGLENLKQQPDGSVVKTHCLQGWINLMASGNAMTMSVPQMRNNWPSMPDFSTSSMLIEQIQGREGLTQEVKDEASLRVLAQYRGTYNIIFAPTEKWERPQTAPSSGKVSFLSLMLSFVNCGVA